MFKKFRSIAALLKKLVGRFSSDPHRQINVPVNISLDFAGDKTQNVHQASSKPLTVTGQTQDISKNAVAFIVPFIRLGDYHLVGHGGEQKTLKLVLEMPNGRVRMTVLAKQFQMIEMHSSVQNYLIETEIVSIYQGDVERYTGFLQHGDKVASRNKTSLLEIAPHTEKRSLLKHFSIF